MIFSKAEFSYFHKETLSSCRVSCHCSKIHTFWNRRENAQKKEEFRKNSEFFRKIECLKRYSFSNTLLLK